MRRLYGGLLGLIVGLSTISAGQAQTGKEIRLDIQPKILADALNEWAQAAGFRLIGPASATRDLLAPRLEGTFTAQAALDRLLAGTHLTYEFIDRRTVAIHEINPASEQNRQFSGAQSGNVQRLAAAQSNAPRGARNDAYEAEARRGTVEEVIVTAQRREERLQDVPISISVLSGSDLDRATTRGVTESLNTVPGVMAQESYIGGGTQVAIRGVAASSTILHGSSPIAYYLDSVPFGLIKTSVGPDANAYDMERVEVLRGPQGTLYGASALNGVVRVLTKDADVDEFQFKGRASASVTEGGGGGNYRADTAINVPLIEGKFAARAVAGYAYESGWISRPTENNANDAELQNYRLKLNARPVDNLSLGLSAWSSRSDFGAPSMARDDGRYTIPVDEPMSTDYDAYGFKLDYDLTAVSITSMTSYLDYTNSGILNVLPLGLPDTPFVNKYFAHVFSQEVNVTSSDRGAWRWSFGGMYRDSKDRTFQTIAGVTPAPLNFQDVSKSIAVFGELTRVFLDSRFEFTAGLRYFTDEVRTHEVSESFTGDPATPLVDASSEFHKTTPRVILNWHATDEITVYASYAEGFRSGFQQQPNVIFGNPEIPPVRADSLKNYEIGSKGLLLDGRLQFDTAVYYLDWQDVQSDNAVIQFGVPVIALTNGESASGAGFDISLTARPVTKLALSVSFSRNSLEYDEAVLAGNQVLFAKGDRLSLSPEYTLGASGDYSVPVGSFELGISASGNYTSEQYMKFATGFGQAESILIARASLSLRSPSNWTATLYGDNLNNENGIIQKAPFPVPDWALRPRPRTVGLQFETHF